MAGSSLSHIYLSPHLDDAVYSCGALMHQQVQAGLRVVVVTICAGDPPPGPLSPFATELHRRWTGAAEEARLPASAEITAARRAEDLAALEHMGALAVHFDTPDCIYRQNSNTRWAIYTNEAGLVGPLHAADSALVRRISSKLATLVRGLGRHHLYVPLGIGQHVDHTLTRRAAEAAGGIHAYYEDYPYVERAGSRWPDAMSPLLEGRQLNPEIVPLSADSLEAQAQAMALYTSQLDSFWASPQALAEAVAAFAAKTGGSRPALRLWRAGA